MGSFPLHSSECRCGGCLRRLEPRLSGHNPRPLLHAPPGNGYTCRTHRVPSMTFLLQPLSLSPPTPESAPPKLARKRRASSPPPLAGPSQPRRRRYEEAPVLTPLPERQPEDDWSRRTPSPPPRSSDKKGKGKALAQDLTAKKRKDQRKPKVIQAANSQLPSITKGFTVEYKFKHGSNEMTARGTPREYVMEPEERALNILESPSILAVFRDYVQCAGCRGLIKMEYRGSGAGASNFFGSTKHEARCQCLKLLRKQREVGYLTKEEQQDFLKVQEQSEKRNRGKVPTELSERDLRSLVVRYKRRTGGREFPYFSKVRNTGARSVSTTFEGIVGPADEDRNGETQNPVSRRLTKHGNNTSSQLCIGKSSSRNSPYSLREILNAEPAYNDNAQGTGDLPSGTATPFSSDQSHCSYVAGSALFNSLSEPYPRPDSRRWAPLEERARSNDRSSMGVRWHSGHWDDLDEMRDTAPSPAHSAVTLSDATLRTPNTYRGGMSLPPPDIVIEDDDGHGLLAPLRPTTSRKLSNERKGRRPGTPYNPRLDDVRRN